MFPLFLTASWRTTRTTLQPLRTSSTCRARTSNRAYFCRLEDAQCRVQSQRQAACTAPAWLICLLRLWRRRATTTPSDLTSGHRLSNSAASLAKLGRSSFPSPQQHSRAPPMAPSKLRVGSADEQSPATRHTIEEQEDPHASGAATGQRERQLAKANTTTTTRGATACAA